jgi:hypothetical protein
MSTDSKRPKRSKSAVFNTRFLRSGRVVTGWLTLLTVVVVALGVVVATGVVPRTRGQAMRTATEAVGGIPQPAAGAAALPTPGETTASDPPWGELEVTPIILTAQPESIFDPITSTDPQPTWYFPRLSRSGLIERLAELGLSDEVRAKLVDEAELDPSIEGFKVRPSRELAMGLSPEARARLYVDLYDGLENVDQRESFRFCGQSADQWLAGSEISADTLRLVEPLIYRHNSFLFFSDLRLVRPLLSSEDECQKLMQALSRDATYLVKLKVPEGADVQRLVNYWGVGGREREIRPLVESLAEAEGGGEIAVAMLLPPFARRHLYTYFTPSPTRNNNRDCLWTALSFFREDEEQMPTENEALQRIFREEYYPIGGNLQLGDMVVIADEDGWLVHAAVYIADDLYFSKQGPNPARPWILMRLQEMKDFYPSTHPRKVGFYRRNGL